MLGAAWLVMLALEKVAGGQDALEGRPGRVLEPQRAEERTHVVKEAAVATGEWLTMQENDQGKGSQASPCQIGGSKYRERELGWTLRC